jgi:sulfate transport system substrate-binding protein
VRNRAYLALQEAGQGRGRTPSISILAEPPVAVVDKNVDRKDPRGRGSAYLQYLILPEGQGDRR